MSRVLLVFFKGLGFAWGYEFHVDLWWVKRKTERNSTQCGRGKAVVVEQVFMLWMEKNSSICLQFLASSVSGDTSSSILFFSGVLNDDFCS